ncbi:MAG: NitT/TauT family transport system substrate-binding protein, partial [Chloroflexota bacterium]|jgi:NitT/TauT family transport system substrate-binding protein|nr:NitT/TauT family transport system substrate-binding protein [Chloroflexota bacterium]
LLIAACGVGGGAQSTPSSRPKATPTSVASTSPSGTAPAGSSAALTAVRLQLQWSPQAQFAGYFAAMEQGYYEAEGLDVTMVPGGGTIAPQTAGSAPNGPEFTVAWVPKVLQAREAGSDLVDIAQVFQRSGTLSVSWKSSNITKPADFKGKRIGVWGSGDEFEVTAGAHKVGLEAGTDYTKVIQGSDMSLLLSKEIDVAEAMIYNEYAQLLESVNPATGTLVQPTDVNVINWNDQGSAMLQDALFARASWLALPGNEDVATRFLKASFKGWIHCRGNPKDCVQYTINAGSTLGAGHQAWMMNEVNPLIWPSPAGIGIMDPAKWQQTVAISKDAGIIKVDPPAAAYRTDLATRALSTITEDTKGSDFVKGEVTVTAGGK